MSHSQEINDLLNRARQRAEAQGFNFSGEVTPTEAFALLQAAPNAVLVDVRTRAEWDWVGRVPGALEIEWVHYPEMSKNPQFIAELQRHAAPDALLLFLCRSGVRSRSAASAAIDTGFSSAYNILEGFEGDKDAANHRGTVGGWRYHGLPWIQG